VDLVGADVELGVAEAVDPEDLGHDGPLLLPGERDEAGPQADGVEAGAEVVEGHPVAEVGGGRGEDVAPGEGGARGRELVLGAGQLHDGGGATAHGDGGGEEAVVGAHEVALAAADLDGDAPAGGADTGVDHGEDDAGAEVLGGPAEGEAPGPDVV